MVFKKCIVLFADRHDGSVFQRIVTRPTAHSRRTRKTVIHRARGIRASVRQGQSARRFVFQGHEENQKSRILRPLVQPTQLSSSVGNMQGM